MKLILGGEYDPEERQVIEDGVRKWANHREDLKQLIASDVPLYVFIPHAPTYVFGSEETNQWVLVSPVPFEPPKELQAPRAPGSAATH